MATQLEPQVEAMGRYVKSHIIGKRAYFDLFPRTVKRFLISFREPKNAIDQFPRTNGADFCLFTVTGQYPDIKMEQSCHVETVVLLSKGDIELKNIKGKCRSSGHGDGKVSVRSRL